MKYHHQQFFFSSFFLFFFLKKKKKPTNKEGIAMLKGSMGAIKTVRMRQGEQ
jgi:hypothetical protein